MPEPLDSIQPVNIERVPDSRPSRQPRDDQEDFYPYLEKQRERKEKDHEKPRQQDTYEHDTSEEETPNSDKTQEKTIKTNSDTLEGPGFVLDVKA